MTSGADEVRRFRRLDGAFRELRDLEPGERAVRLTEIRAEDGPFAAELRAMLEHDLSAAKTGDDVGSAGAVSRVGRRFGAAEELLREIAGGVAAESSGAGDDADRRWIGHYRLERELGLGASGVVHLAVDERNGRKVALKLLHGAAAGPVAMARFRREAAILQRLEHPGIAAIHEADAVDGPGGRQCFIAMELVRGVPITRWVAAARRSVPQIIELLADVADAVAHAHARGVVHRDIKPANVLVGEDGRPRVLDLGAARLLQPDRTDGGAHFTETGQLVGTVPYMAPEQFDGIPERIGPPADVYALGVLGYRLLAGRLPLDIAGQPLVEAARIAREEEPSSLGSLDRRLRGPVAAVIGTSLEKEPGRRYPDAAALAADLRRLAAGERVRARPPSFLELVRRAARRNRRLLATFVAAFAVLSAILAVTVTLAVTAERLRRAEVADRRDAEARRQEADELRTRADAERDAAIRLAASASLNASESAIRAGEIAEARRQLARVPEALRGWTWDHLAARADRSDGPPLIVPGEPRLGTVLAVELGGVPALVVSENGDPARLHVVREGTIVASFATLPWINQIAAGPDPGTVLVAGHSGVEGLDLESGERRTIAPPTRGARSMSPTPDGGFVAIGGIRDRIWWHDVHDGTPVAELRLPGGRNIRLLPAGPRTVIPADAPAITAPAESGPLPPDLAASLEHGLLAVSADSAGWFIDLDAAGRLRARSLWDEERELLSASAINLAGDRIVSTWADGHVQVRQAPDWTVSAEWQASTQFVGPVLFLPDDSIAVAGTEGVSWWTTDGRRRRRLAGHEDVPWGLEHVGDARLVTVGVDGSVRHWDLHAPDEPAVLVHPRQSRRVAFLTDGSILATGGGRHPTTDGHVRLWDVRDGSSLATFSPSLREVHALLVLPPAEAGGAELIVAAGVGVAAWGAGGGEPRWTALPRVTHWSLADLGEGGILAAGFHGRLVRLDVADGTVLAEGEVPVEGPRLVRTAEGPIVVAGRVPGTHRTRWMLVDPDSLEELVRRDLEHGAPLSALLLPGPWSGASGEPASGASGPARPVAIGHADDSVRIVDSRTLETIASIPDAGLEPTGLAVLPGDDGSWSLVIGGQESAVRFHPRGESLPAESILVHDGPITDLAVSPDGRTIATSSSDRTARIWRRSVPDRRLAPVSGWPDPAWPDARAATKQWR